ncbi:hypothetical protein J31TS4_17560 [Paenibacillus sp. J31TS4]|nr:hypothetical protein J31TS4_17560 [Paenibacillus sp. J31TS4]
MPACQGRERLNHLENVGEGCFRQTPICRDSSVCAVAASNVITLLWEIDGYFVFLSVKTTFRKGGGKKNR